MYGQQVVSELTLKVRSWPAAPDPTTLTRRQHLSITVFICLKEVGLLPVSGRRAMAGLSPL